MKLAEAVELLATSELRGLGPTTWADLGCGRGLFTTALAELLAPGSSIHALDRTRSVLQGIPPVHNGIRITPHVGDFSRLPWPFGDVVGILMANSLHFVEDQAGFIRSCAERMNPAPVFLIVEYDTDVANRWVPHPLSQTSLRQLFRRTGYASVRVLRSRPSTYRRADLYSALILREGGNTLFSPVRGRRRHVERHRAR